MLPKHFLLLLIPLAGVVSSARTSEDASIIDDSFPVSDLDVTPHQELQKRLETGCFGNGDDAYSGAMGIIANRLQNNDPERLEYLPVRSNIAYRHMNLEVCVRNNYYFDNMHIKRWEIGWAVDQIYRNCCAGKEHCNLGIIVAHGDTGKNVPIAIGRDGACDYPIFKEV
jgi:hypothetical protein